MHPLVLLAAKAVAAVALDQLLGEPRRWHPLVLFGRYARALENLIRPHGPGHLMGMLAWCAAVLPGFFLAGWLHARGPVVAAVVDVLLLYFALGRRSLAEHAAAVAGPLAAGDLPAAREQVGRMVSRETQSLDEEEVAKATVESVLENGNDAVFGALFWFVLLGGAGALLFRLANTLDAMWGYRTPRYLRFGWAAARIDDVLNFVPARLTALSYALLGELRQALACWRKQAPLHDSPNAGPVMAAGAGALGLRLGGPARYHGQMEFRPTLGEGAAPAPADIHRAVGLVNRATALWLGALVLAAALATLARLARA